MRQNQQTDNVNDNNLQSTPNIDSESNSAPLYGDIPYYNQPCDNKGDDVNIQSQQTSEDKGGQKGNSNGNIMAAVITRHEKISNRLHSKK